MLTFKLASTATKLNLSNGEKLYFFGKHLPKKITSFRSCLDLSLWRNYYQPFASAIINAHSKEVILVRDHLGIEPLYYCNYLGKQLIFGQSIPDILHHLPRTPPLLQKQIHMLFSEYKYYSDETHYQGIYRVEPGCLIRFKSNGSLIKKPFWNLSDYKSILYYDNNHDYFEHFSSLMNEAILNSIGNTTNIASEFSAGLDSSAIYCAAVNSNRSPKLFMHINSPETTLANQYDDSYEKKFIEHFQIDNIQRVTANKFDPLAVFTEYSSWFAGAAPYIFPMFSNPVHQAVKAGLHPILLSGFGGDQCASGQLSANFFLPELIHQGKYKQAWDEIKSSSKIKKILHYARYMHPHLYKQSLNLKKAKQHIINTFQDEKYYQSPIPHPYERLYYASVRETEIALLQGPHSHEVRMRIEYSSIISKQMGFEYRYPLLYPKLVEFMLSIPTIQKRLDGRGRYLIRQYLHKNLQEDIFATYRKRNGLGIIPSTFHLFQEKFKQGYYQDNFQHLPYAHLIKNKSSGIELRNNIKGFMLNSWAQFLSTMG